ncbi:MAG TPA: cobalamin-dependent protein [Polyangia bacterium]|jgi:methanogenic corrinoid protein MtbC1
MDDLGPLVTMLLEGDSAAALRESQRLRASEVDGPRLVVKALEAAMDAMSARCTTQQFNLLEIMLTGRAAMAVARDAFADGTVPATHGTVVIGTPQGDVHDLGKNITKMVLTAKGFRVVDCGKDCPITELVDAAAREGARAVLVSGLISPVVPLVRQLRGLLRERGLAAVALIAGGAALKQCSPEALNVDYVAQDAFDGARYLQGLAANGGGR